MNDFSITFDIDWAPDWCIQLCAEICANAGIPATFFATHPSPFIKELQSDSRFEVGIHPNLLPTSTQGNNINEVIDYCLNVVPNARSLRTHSLYQTSPFYFTLTEIYPELKTDVSLFLPLHPHLQPTVLYCSDNKSIVRLPYFWEDDIMISSPDWHWQETFLEAPGLKIFTFHPILVALNSLNLSSYKNLRKFLHHKPLINATLNEVMPFISNNFGTQEFLRKVVHSSKKTFQTIDQISQDFINKNLHYPHPPHALKNNIPAVAMDSVSILRNQGEPEERP